MKQIFIFLLAIIGVAQAQFSPTSAKSAFKWGVSVGTRDSSAYAANDSLVVVINRQGRMMYRSTDGYWKILSNAAASDYVPYNGAVDNVNLGTYRLSARSLRTDSIYANGSGGMYLLTNSGAAVAHWGGGGSVEVDFKGFAGYDANRAGSYTARSFTDKNYVDSADGLRVRYTDTAAMLSNYRRTTTKITNSDLVNSTISGVPLGSNLNSLSAGNGLSGTTYNGGTGYTWQVDTSVISTKANVTGLLVGYATTGSLAGKLNISDTAAMLSGYKTYYPRTAISAGTGISYNAATGVITNSSPSSGGTVTSVSAGTGMSFTTITSSGPVNADTFVLATRAYAQGLDVAKVNTNLGNVNGVLSNNYGGAGSVNGILKANGSGVVSAASAGTDYVIPSALSGYLPLTAGSGKPLSGSLFFNSSFGTSTPAISIYNNSGASSSNIALIDFRVNNSFSGNERVASISATNPNAGANNGGRLNFLVSPNGSSTTPELAGYFGQDKSLTLLGSINGTSLSMSGATQLATSSGRVLIKTTTDNGTDALQVAGSASFSGNLNIVASSLGFPANAGFYNRSSDNVLFLKAATGGYYLLDNSLNTKYSWDATNNHQFIGAATFSSLSGSGDRMVVANSSGTLSTQAIPTGTATTGTYTPTISSTTNIASVDAVGTFRWVRVGNIVTVSGSVSVTPTNTSSTTGFYISLPIASTFSSMTQASGTAAFRNGSAQLSAPINSVNGGTTANMVYHSLATIQLQPWYIIFQYEVL